MTLIIFVAAVLASVVLDRQKKRNRVNEREEYLRLGWDVPVMKPAVPVLEAFFSIMLGLTFAVAGGLVLSVMLENLTLFPVAAMVNYLAVVIAGGLGLVTMGARVLMAHKELGTMRQRER